MGGEGRRGTARGGERVGRDFAALRRPSPPFAARPFAAWVLFLALGVVAGLTESPERALVSAATGGRHGSGFGVYHALTGVAALVGGIALGLVFQRASGATAFVVSAVGALGLVILWPFWTRVHRVPPPCAPLSL